MQQVSILKDGEEKAEGKVELNWWSLLEWKWWGNKLDNCFYLNFNHNSRDQHLKKVMVMKMQDQSKDTEEVLPQDSREKQLQNKDIFTRKENILRLKIYLMDLLKYGMKNCKSWVTFKISSNIWNDFLKFYHNYVRAGYDMVYFPGQKILTFYSSKITTNRGSKVKLLQK